MVRVIGTWTITPPALPEGDVTLVAVQSDSAGNSSDTPVNAGQSPSFGPVDTTAPVGLTIDTLQNTPIQTPVITGTGEPGATVSLEANGVLVIPVDTGTVVPDGTWSITPTADLPVGVIALTATQTDPAGNTSAQVTGSIKIDLDVATIDEVVDNTPTITGTGIDSRTVTLSADLDSDYRTPPSEIGTATVAGGVWSIPYGALTDGEVELSVTQSDGATTSGVFKRTVVIDTEALPPTFDIMPVSKSLQPTITGTGEPGATVTVETSRGVSVGSETVGNDGNWSLDLSADLPVVGTVDTVALDGELRDVALGSAGTTAYVADGTSGLRIIDVSNPATASVVGTVATANAVGIAINGTTAYVADGTSGLRIIDVSDPATASVVGTVATANAVGVAINGTTAYVADGTSGLRIIDVSDPATASVVGTVATANAVGVAINGTTAYVADGTSGLRIIDVSDPATASVVGTVNTNGALHVAIYGTTAYVADGGSGLRIIDVSDPATASVVGTLDIDGVVSDVALSSNGATAYMSDISGGLEIADVSDPTSAHVISKIATHDTNAVTVSPDDNTAYILGVTFGLEILDVADPGTISLSATQTDSFGNPSVARTGSVVVDANAIALVVINALTPTGNQRPEITGTAEPSDATKQVTVTVTADLDLDGSPDTVLGEVDVQADGTWSLSEYEYNLPVGTVALQATQQIVITEISDGNNPVLIPILQILHSRVLSLFQVAHL